MCSGTSSPVTTSTQELSEEAKAQYKGFMRVDVIATGRIPVFRDTKEYDEAMAALDIMESLNVNGDKDH